MADNVVAPYDDENPSSEAVSSSTTQTHSDTPLQSDVQLNQLEGNNDNVVGGCSPFVYSSPHGDKFYTHSSSSIISSEQQPRNDNTGSSRLFNQSTMEQAPEELENPEIAYISLDQVPPQGDNSYSLSPPNTSEYQFQNETGVSTSHSDTQTLPLVEQIHLEKVAGIATKPINESLQRAAGINPVTYPPNSTRIDECLVILKTWLLKGKIPKTLSDLKTLLASTESGLVKDKDKFVRELKDLYKTGSN